MRMFLKGYQNIFIKLGIDSSEIYPGSYPGVDTSDTWYSGRGAGRAARNPNFVPEVPRERETIFGGSGLTPKGRRILRDFSEGYKNIRNVPRDFSTMAQQAYESPRETYHAITGLIPRNGE